MITPSFAFSINTAGIPQKCLLDSSLKAGHQQVLETTDQQLNIDYSHQERFHSRKSQNSSKSTESSLKSKQTQTV